MPRIITTGILAGQLHALDQAINKAGYATFLSTHQYDAKAEANHIRDQIARAIDGIILYPSGHYGQELKELIDSSFPLVTIGSTLPVHTWNVTVDRFKGGYLQMKHLLDQGRRRILVLAPIQSKTAPTSLAKYHGRGRALTEAGFTQDPQLIAELEQSSGNPMQDGADAMTKVLKRKIKFDAVVTNSDTAALGALSVLKTHGISIPDDVAVVGFDDEPFASWITPALTTIRQPHDLGTAAFDLLLTQIQAQADNRKLEPQEMIIQPQLIIRESTVGHAPSTGA